MKHGEILVQVIWTWKLLAEICQLSIEKVESTWSATENIQTKDLQYKLKI